MKKPFPENFPSIYREMVLQAHDRGLNLLMTSGQACLFYKLCHATKDADLIMESSKSGQILEFLEEYRPPHWESPRYHPLSPPLDSSWMKGGWSVHIEYPGKSDHPDLRLDFFGCAPRASHPLPNPSDEVYADRETVAQMKMTRRLKDWDSVNYLGLQMLAEGNPRGLLYIFNGEHFHRSSMNPTSELIAERPLLALLESTRNDIDTLTGAADAERTAWMTLDKVRLLTYSQALRPFLKNLPPHNCNTSFQEQHQMRVDIAKQHLDPRPIASFGVETLMDDVLKRLERMGMSEHHRSLLPIPRFRASLDAVIQN